MRRIIVIGGGASGLMAAIMAAREGARVTLLEKNEKPGRKLLVTGNGKCNLTNTDQGLQHYHSTSPDFVRMVLEQFGEKDTLSFFSDLGLLPKSRGTWIYPYSEQASAVLMLLEQEAQRLNINLKFREEVTDLRKTSSAFSVATATWTYEADRVILACGGPASEISGSGEDGFAMAGRLGHTLADCQPALVPLRGTAGNYSLWAGTRMDGIVSLYIDEQLIRSEKGELQFADYGISGIAVFQLSGEASLAVSAGHKTELQLDLMPEYSESELTRMLSRRRERMPKAKDAALFTGMLPDRMIRMITGKKTRTPEYYAHLLKTMKFPVRGPHSLKRAQVSTGGVLLRELNPASMESRLVSGLYITGEVTEVFGDCGGYNLQWAWSTGAVAGRAAALKE